MSWFHQQRRWIWVVFALFVVYQTAVSWQQGVLGNSDQANIGIMELKASNPALFARDYVFKDDTLFKFYTPAFISLIAFLKPLTGSFDKALAALMPFTITIYLAGMFYLCLEITNNEWVSLLISLLSAYPRWAVGVTFWGVAGLETMIPRTLFLMAFPWVVGWWYRRLGRVRWQQMALLGLITGLLANLHPVSGLFVVQLMTTMLILVYAVEWINGRISWRVALQTSITQLVATAVGTLVGIWPTLNNFVQNTAPPVNLPRPPFETFVDVLYQRLFTLFPLQPESLNFWGHPLTATEQTIIIWAYLGCMVLLLTVWGIVWRFARAPYIFTAWLLVQIPMVYLLTFFDAHAMVILLLAYALLVLAQKPERQDWWLLAFLTIVIVYSYIICYGLSVLWLRFEWWSITTVMAEQMRMAGFIYLPMYGFIGRFLTTLQTQLAPNPYRHLLTLTLVCLVLQPGPFSALLVAGCCAVLLFTRRPAYAHWLKPPWTYAGTAVLALGILFLVFQPPSTAQESDLLQDSAELYDWARTQTPINSLFYTNSLEFRFRAQRSITHSWKDLGIAYYSQTLLVPFYERYTKLESGYQDPERLLQYADEYETEYIVTETADNLTLPLLIVLQNTTYTVYQVEDK